MHYVEHFDSWDGADVGVAGAWTLYDVTGNHGIPASAILELNCTNNYNISKRTIGARNTASSGEADSFRRLSLGVSISADNNAVMHTQLDSSGYIQCWVGTTIANSQLVFKILGYWIGGVYTDAFDIFTPTSPSGWEGHALDTHGVGSGHIVEVMAVNSGTSSGHFAGIRASGSSIDRRFDIRNSKSSTGGGEQVMSLLASPSGSNHAVEIWADDITEVEFRLLGYFSTPPGDYTEDKILFPDPVSQGIWTELDVGTSGVPSSVLGQFVTQSQGATTVNGLRETGSTLNNRFLLLDVEQVGWHFGHDTATIHSKIDSFGKLEFYTSNNLVDVEYSLVGYWDNLQFSDNPFALNKSTDLFIKGLNPFIHYVETDNDTFNASVTGAWTQTAIPSSLNIPIPTEASPITLEIVIFNNSTSSSTGGLRSTGSSLERKFDLNPQTLGGVDALTLMVPLDEAGNIELYASHLTSVSFQVLGYWRGARYVENKTEFQINTEDSWVNLDLGASYADKVVEIVISNDSTTIQQSGGIRSIGSSVERYQSLSFGAAGRDYTSMQVNTSGSAGTVQVFASNSGNIAFNVVGRWTTPPGQYTELMELAAQATSTSFTIKDIGIAEGNVAEIVIEHRDFNNDRNYGLRESGSISTRAEWTLRQTNSLSDNLSSSMLRSSVNLVNGSSIEIRSNFGAGAHQFTKVGFWSSFNLIPSLSSGSMHMVISGTPASIQTSGAKGGLYPSGLSLFTQGVQIAEQVDFFMEGVKLQSGVIDLFMFGVHVSKTDTEFSAAYPSGLSMFTTGSGIIPESGQFGLVTLGSDSTAASGDLFINSIDFESGSGNLFLKVIEPQTGTITLYIHNLVDLGPGLIREQDAIFYLSRRIIADINVTTERIEDIQWDVGGVLFGNKYFLAQSGETTTAGDGTEPQYDDMGGSFSSSKFGSALVGSTPDQQNILGHIIAPADYPYAGSNSIMTAFWMSGAKTSGNIVDAGWFFRSGPTSSPGDSNNDHTVGIKITSGNNIQVRTSVRDLPYDLPTGTGLWWGGTTHYGTPTGSSWTWRTPDEYWAWDEAWPEVEIAHDDIAFFVVRSDFIASGVVPGAPSHMNVSLSVNGQPWVFIGSGDTGPPASSLFSFNEPRNKHAENTVGIMVQAVNDDFQNESLLVNEIVLWSDADTLTNDELSSFHSIVSTYFRPLDEFRPTIVPPSTYVRRTVGPYIHDPFIPGDEISDVVISPGLTVTLEVGIGDYGEDASAYLLEEVPPSGFVIRNIRPHANITYPTQGSRPPTQQSIFHDPQSGIMEPYDHASGVNSYGASIRWVNNNNHPQHDERRLPTPTGIYTYELFPVSYVGSPPVENFVFDGSGLFFNGTTGSGVFDVQTTGDTSGTVSGLIRGLPVQSMNLYTSGPTSSSGTITLYIRTQEEFTSSYIGVSDRTPEGSDFRLAADGDANLDFLPGIEFGPHLFTKGPLFLDGNCPLFTTGPAARDKTLYIHGFSIFNTSGAFPSGLQIVEQGHITSLSSGNLFTSGPIAVSGTCPFYTQAGGVGRITLFEHGHTDRAGAVSGFIKGPEFTTTSGNFAYSLDETLFTFPSGGNSPDLYMKGPEFIITSGNFPYPGDPTLFTTPSGGLVRDLFTQGHGLVTNTMTLFIGPIPARQNWTLYLKTDNNIINSSVNLFTHGANLPPGVNLAFNNTPMYLEAKDADFPFTAGGTGDWTLFLKAASDDLTIDENWSLFLKADSTITGMSPLYTYAHASGESPRGIVITGSVGMVCSVDPDDSSRIGYTPHDSDDDPWTLFIKGNPGFFNTTNMYISGAAPVSFAASGNLFVRGLFEQQTGIAPFYLMGVSGLFNNGPNGLHLFLDAGTLVYNTSGNLYVHGY